VGWTPSRDPSLGPRPTSLIPSLYTLALQLLVKHIDAVSTLWGVPDLIKTEVAAAVCQQRRMDPTIAQLFADSAPSELVLTDCTQLDAEAMGQLLATAGSRRLERLELCMCGRGFGDEAAAAVADKVPLSGLRRLKLTGAYRLSDAGENGMCQP
jgi:DNA repair protein RAD7